MIEVNLFLPFLDDQCNRNILVYLFQTLVLVHSLIVFENVIVLLELFWALECGFVLDY